MPKYYAPVTDGVLAIGDEQYPVVNGIVECPVAFAVQAELTAMQLTEDQEAALAAESKGKKGK